MICPRCKYRWRSKPHATAGRKGGAVKTRKGFAVAGQPDSEARRRAWETRRAGKKKEKPA